MTYKRRVNGHINWLKGHSKQNTRDKTDSLTNRPSIDRISEAKFVPEEREAVSSTHGSVPKAVSKEEVSKQRARQIAGTSLSSKTSQLEEPQLSEMTVPAQNGIRDIARRITPDLLKAAAISTVALLAGGAIGAVVLPALAGKLALDTVASWLVETGGEALKNWVIDWAKDKVFKPEDNDRDTGRLARALDQEMRRNDDLAKTVVVMLEKLDARDEIIRELANDVTEQTRIIQCLADDIKESRVENQRLRAWSEQLKRQLKLEQETAATANVYASQAPAAAPLVEQQPPTGPPNDDQQFLRDLLSSD